jgi:hypothetical protein
MPGMSKTQVQAIMSTFPGINDAGNAGRIFCHDTHYKDRDCLYPGTTVYVEMANDRLASAKIDLD